MKKLLIVFLAIILAIPVGAVLKERDLARTLGVLRAELEMTERQQKINMQRYSTMQTTQHEQLVDYMQRSEQIALMLYSQKQDFTFDMAYACQQATDLYRELSGRTVPYARIQERMQSEITRYDGLIHSLQDLPPAVVIDEDGCIMSKEKAERLARQQAHRHDSVHGSLIDSAAEQLAVKIDSIADSLGVADTTAQAVADSVKHLSDAYKLTKAQQADRDTCLAIAFRVRAKLLSFTESVNADNLYYSSVSKKVEDLNSYAQERYKMLQQNIFVNAGNNYFATLLRLPFYIKQARKDLSDKYAAFDQHESHYSEWRGPIVKFVCIFMLLWIFIATVLSQVILRLIPNRWLPADYQPKRWLYFLVSGMIVFAVSVTIIHYVITQNFMLMATGLMISVAWLAIAVLVSLLIRVKAEHIKTSVKAYTPFIVMAFIVIIFRIMFVPNIVVNLVYPPLLLGFCIWQMRVLRVPKGAMPSSDIIYSGISLLALVIATVLAWTGYVLFAVEIMVWWMFQLAAIQTITSTYYLLDKYETKTVLKKVKARIDVDGDGHYDSNNEEIDDDDVLCHMRKGSYITTTWLFDFFNRVAVPILGVCSIAMSIWYAADIFEMTDALREYFYYNFIDQKGIVQLSLYKIFVVVCCWFVFRYLNYVVRSLYHHAKQLQTNLRPEQYNFTLANNVIAIIVWGSYIVYALFLLQVPSSGISVVTAGLATGMGFAMKDLLENFFYGISLMTGRIRVGDYIECDGIQGRVDSITYQSTQVVTYDGSVIAFLNAQLFSKNFKNLTRNHHYEFVKVPIGVAYGADIEEVRHVLVSALRPLNITMPDGRQLLRPDSDVSVVFNDFGASSVDLLVCYWVLVDQKAAFAGRVKEAIYNALNDHNLEIPFPQCDVHMRN